MASAVVVIDCEIAQLARQIERIPEKHAIKVLASNRADQSFNERVRNWNVWNRLDLIDFEHAQICQPTVKAKQRIVVGAEIFRWWLGGDRLIEHSANRDAMQCRRARHQSR